MNYSASSVMVETNIVYKNMFIKHFNLKILENDSNQIEMRQIRDSSNVSNFYLISDYWTTTSPFSQNKILFQTSGGSGFPLALSCYLRFQYQLAKVFKPTIFQK